MEYSRAARFQADFIPDPNERLVEEKLILRRTLLMIFSLSALTDGLYPSPSPGSDCNAGTGSRSG